jgi:hypothetical protein
VTRAEFDLFLNGVAVLCAIMALVNLALLKKRGPSAWMMSIAFLLAGSAGLLYVQRQETLAKGAAILVGILLGADFLLRTSKRGQS